MGHSIQKDLEEILECELPRTRFRETVRHSDLSTRGDESYLLYAETRALMSRQALLNATVEEARSKYHDMNKAEWDEEAKSRFCSRMLEWRDATNLSRKLRDFVTRNPPRIAAHPLGDNRSVDPKDQEQKLKAVMSMVDVVLKRQHRRESC